MNRPATRRFIITSAPRTGSTMLRHLLNSHSAICSHGEVFALPLIRGFVGLRQGENSPILERLQRLRDEYPVTYLRDYVFCDDSCRTVGAKILYKTLEIPRWKDVFDTIRGDLGIHIVHLTRENRLKRYLSYRIANQTTNVKVVFLGRRLPTIPKVTILAEDCLRDIEAIEADERHIRDIFRDHQVFEVTYEQALDPASGCLEDLQRFLGVVPEQLKYETQKLVSDDLHEVLANYDDLERSFRGTRHHRYFD